MKGLITAMCNKHIVLSLDLFFPQPGDAEKATAILEASKQPIAQKLVEVIEKGIYVRSKDPIPLTLKMDINPSEQA